jgi:hypothetical protein
MSFAIVAVLLSAGCHDGPQPKWAVYWRSIITSGARSCAARSRFGQLFLHGGTHVRARKRPVAVRQRLVMATVDFRARADLAQQLARGGKVVVERFHDVPGARVDLFFASSGSSGRPYPNKCHTEHRKRQHPLPPSRRHLRSRWRGWPCSRYLCRYKSRSSGSEGPFHLDG